ncbi:hypothetical protein NHX12_010448 [Muraenolepis orangiensis]|uniref:Uncharacterized protein n=1 Tax=Muraenolepis orangiensis TaxID=630683 RepID=A0A9Q0I9C4_9TELE|nr:hypothetical protein NHX12_010448 [Muraenolepis orangiensis]
MRQTDLKRRDTRPRLDQLWRPRLRGPSQLVAREVPLARIVLVFGHFRRPIWPKIPAKPDSILLPEDV